MYQWHPQGLWSWNSDSGRELKCEAILLLHLLRGKIQSDPRSANGCIAHASIPQHCPNLLAHEAEWASVKRLSSPEKPLHWFPPHPGDTPLGCCRHPGHPSLRPHLCSFLSASALGRGLLQAGPWLRRSHRSAGPPASRSRRRALEQQPSHTSCSCVRNSIVINLSSLF